MTRDPDLQKPIILSQCAELFPLYLSNSFSLLNDSDIPKLFKISVVMILEKMLANGSFYEQPIKENLPRSFSLFNNQLKKNR